MPAQISLRIKSDALGTLEKRLNRKLGRKATRKFMAKAAETAIRDAESLTVRHLTTTLALPTATIREHIYFRSRPGADTTVVAWSPSRRIPLKRLSPEQTSTGVSWRFAGKRRSKRHAFIGPGGHVFIRAKQGSALAGRLPIVPVRGPTITWSSAFDERIYAEIERSYFRSLNRWMDSGPP